MFFSREHEPRARPPARWLARRRHSTDTKIAALDCFRFPRLSDVRRRFDRVGAVLQRLTEFQEAKCR